MFRLPRVHESCFTLNQSVKMHHSLEMDYKEVVPNIVAENAALKAKIKQEYDIACAIVGDINKIDSKIRLYERENKQYDLLHKCIESELGKCEEELENIFSSRERAQSNIENLKKQYEFKVIEEEQKRKEHESVGQTYELMIRNTKEIYNSNLSVKKKNELQSKLDALLIQFAVLKMRVREVNRKKYQLQQIQELKLRNTILELAKTFVELKRLDKKKKLLASEIKEKKEVLEKLKEQKNEQKSEEIAPEKPKEVVIKTTNSLKSPLMSSSATMIPSMNIPSTKDIEQMDLLKYFQQLNSFKSNHTPFVLPPLLFRSSPSRIRGTPKSPAIEQKISPVTKSDVRKLPEKGINKVTQDNTRDVMDKPETPVPSIAVEEKPAENIPNNEHFDTPIDIDKTVNIVDNTSGEMTNRIRNMNLNCNNTGSPKSISSLPVPMKSTPERFQKENIASPKSRIQIRPDKPQFRNASGIPVRCSPSSKMITSSQSAQKREFVKYAESQKKFPVSESLSVLSKENVSRFNKKNEACSPKRFQKQSKMDYDYAPRIEIQKMKRKPGFEKEPQYGVMNADQYRQNIRKNLPHVDEMTVKSNLTIRRKKVSDDECVPKQNANVHVYEDVLKGETITNTEKMQKFLDFVEQQFPDDAKNLRSAFHDNPELIKKISQFERSDEHQVEKRRKRMKSVAAGKHLREVGLSKQLEMNTLDFAKGIEMLKQRSPSESSEIGRDMQNRDDAERDRSGEDTKSDENPVDIAENMNIEDEENLTANDYKKEIFSEKIQINDENRSKYFTNEKKVRKNNRPAKMYVQEPYVENYQSENGSTYADHDSRAYELGSVDLDVDEHYSDRFSPISEVFSTTTPDTHPFNMPLFGSSNNGSAFGFGCSVNQIFGSNDESTPNDGGQGGGFSFNFTEPTGNQQPFRFY